MVDRMAALRDDVGLLALHPKFGTDAFDADRALVPVVVTVGLGDDEGKLRCAAGVPFSSVLLGLGLAALGIKRVGG